MAWECKHDMEVADCKVCRGHYQLIKNEVGKLSLVPLEGRKLALLLVGFAQYLEKRKLPEDYNRRCSHGIGLTAYTCVACERVFRQYGVAVFTLTKKKITKKGEQLEFIEMLEATADTATEEREHDRMEPKAA